jgi:hypothetical protein
MHNMLATTGLLPKFKYLSKSVWQRTLFRKAFLQPILALTPPGSTSPGWSR